MFSVEDLKKTKHKKLTSKAANNRVGWAVFSTANRPKTSPNIKFCSIKIAHRATCMNNDFEHNMPWKYRCEIFGFFLLSFPQSERKIY